MNREHTQARDELRATGALLMAKIAGAGVDWAKGDPQLAEYVHDFLTTVLMYLRAEAEAKDELLALVKEWRARLAACAKSFELAKVEIRRELRAVGGYATTTPSAEGGYRHGYTLTEGAWSEGGRIALGGYYPEVGDRCHAIATAHRDTSLAVSDAVAAICGYLAKATGQSWTPDKHPEELLFAIYTSRGLLEEAS